VSSISAFLTSRQQCVSCVMSRTGVTSGTGTAYPSGASACIPGF